MYQAIGGDGLRLGNALGGCSSLHQQHQGLVNLLLRTDLGKEVSQTDVEDLGEVQQLIIVNMHEPRFILLTATRPMSQPTSCSCSASFSCDHPRW